MDELTVRRRCELQRLFPNLFEELLIQCKTLCDDGGMFSVQASYILAEVWSFTGVDILISSHLTFSGLFWGVVLSALIYVLSIRSSS